MPWKRQGPATVLQGDAQAASEALTNTPWAGSLAGSHVHTHPEPQPGQPPPSPREKTKAQSGQGDARVTSPRPLVQKMAEAKIRGHSGRRGQPGLHSPSPRSLLPGSPAPGPPRQAGHRPSPFQFLLSRASNQEAAVGGRRGLRGHSRKPRQVTPPRQPPSHPAGHQWAEGTAATGQTTAAVTMPTPTGPGGDRQGPHQRRCEPDPRRVLLLVFLLNELNLKIT